MTIPITEQLKVRPKAQTGEDLQINSKKTKQIKRKRSDPDHIDNIVREVMSYKRDENGLLIGTPWRGLPASINDKRNW